VTDPPVRYLNGILIGLALFAVVGIIAAAALSGGPSDDPPDEFKGGTAREWQQQTEDWQRIALKFKGVAAKYRELNNELLAELGQ
jgi:hypothetical protein